MEEEKRSIIRIHADWSGRKKRLLWIAIDPIERINS
jgi:hypothetical protein